MLQPHGTSQCGHTEPGPGCALAAAPRLALPVTAVTPLPSRQLPPHGERIPMRPMEPQPRGGLVMRWGARCAGSRGGTATSKTRDGEGGHRPAPSTCSLWVTHQQWTSQPVACPHLRPLPSLCTPKPAPPQCEQPHEGALGQRVGSIHHLKISPGPPEAPVPTSQQRQPVSGWRGVGFCCPHAVIVLIRSACFDEGFTRNEKASGAGRQEEIIKSQMTFPSPSLPAQPLLQPSRKIMHKGGGKLP